jgi:hypothetical protein
VGWKSQTESTARAARRGGSVIEAKNNGQPSDDLMFVYLVELDGGTTDTPAAGFG